MVSTRHLKWVLQCSRDSSERTWAVRILALLHFPVLSVSVTLGTARHPRSCVGVGQTCLCVWLQRRQEHLWSKGRRCFLAIVVLSTTTTLWWCLSELAGSGFARRTASQFASAGQGQRLNRPTVGWLSVTEGSWPAPRCACLQSLIELRALAARISPLKALCVLLCCWRPLSHPRTTQTRKHGLARFFSTSDFDVCGRPQ